MERSYTKTCARGALPELMAPAGKEEVVDAVLEAGADAVYLSGKAFNMRRHRSDFHFTDAQLAGAVEKAQAAGARLYVTVNALITEGETDDLVDYLRLLASLKVDALIVQDLAVPQLMIRHDITLPLHASTMMNVNSAGQARFLRRHGFTRAVTSRDLTLAEVRWIKEQSGLDVEYFVHGDLCSVQSGQCLTSGILFGKSSNRGQCMKPCRWAYDLVSEAGDRTLLRGKYPLAAKDICLVHHLGLVVASGIDALKIEGRMRPAETLAPLVKLYRQRLDELADNPLKPSRLQSETAAMHRSRTRNLTSGFAFKTPDDRFMDLAGDREPLFLSRSGRLRSWEDESARKFTQKHAQAELPVAAPELTVVVGTKASAMSAVAAGAERIMLSWEGDLGPESGWSVDDIGQLANDCDDRGVSLAMTGPRIMTDRECGEFERVLEQIPEIGTYSVASLAAIAPLRQHGKTIWADAALNVLNAAAAAFLAESGVSRMVPSLEASFEEIVQMLGAAPGIAFEPLVYGPLVGMVLEHCLVGMATQHIGNRDLCKMPCAADSYTLVDRGGARRRVCTDRYCRNHILLEHTLNMVPVLRSFLTLAPASVRLDARLHSPDDTGFVTRCFRSCLDDPARIEPSVQAMTERFPTEAFTYGAYPVGIGNDDMISRLALKKEEKHDNPRG